MVKISNSRLAELRRYAEIERTAVMELRGREGEDPLATLAELPSVDELVVRELRDEMLEDRGQLAEFSMARLAAMGSGDDAAEHRENARRVEFALLREIAEENPDLVPAVWAAAGRLSPG